MAENKESPQRTFLPEGFCPGEYDVICGRGKGLYLQPGNKHFRSIVMAHIDSYKKLESRIEKTDAIDKIIHQVQSQNNGDAQFIRKHSSGLWEVLSETKVREKVGHAIREILIPRLKKNSNQSIPTPYESGGFRSSTPSSSQSSNKGDTSDDNELKQQNMNDLFEPFPICYCPLKPMARDSSTLVCSVCNGNDVTSPKQLENTLKRKNELFNKELSFIFGESNKSRKLKATNESQYHRNQNIQQEFPNVNSERLYQMPSSSQYDSSFDVINLPIDNTQYNHNNSFHSYASFPPAVISNPFRLSSSQSNLPNEQIRQKPLDLSEISFLLNDCDDDEKNE